MSRPEGCKIQVCTAQDIHSLHKEGPALQESRSTHQMQAQGVAAASVRGHVVPQLRLLSENAEHLAPGARPGPLDHVQYTEPSPEATLPRHAGVVTFRLRGGLPRGVAILGDRRPTLSCICTPARRIPRRPSNLTFVAVPQLKRSTSRHPPSALSCLVATNAMI